MEELVSIMARRQQHKAAASSAASEAPQKILPVYFDISFAECASVTPASSCFIGFGAAKAEAYTSALAELRKVGSRLIDHIKYSFDQVCHSMWGRTVCIIQDVLSNPWHALCHTAGLCMLVPEGF